MQEGGPWIAARKFLIESRDNRKSIRLLLVPAVLYAVQNTMVIHAISYLSAVEFSVARQIKVPVTGVFSVTKPTHPPRALPCTTNQLPTTDPSALTRARTRTRIHTYGRAVQ